MSELLELPSPYEELSIAEIADRWCRHYMDLLPDSIQRRSEVASHIIDEIQAEELYGSRVHCMQPEDFSEIEVFRGVRGWMSWRVEGADLRKYEEKRFGIDSKLKDCNSPYVGFSERNKFKKFVDTRDDAEAVGVTQKEFIQCWVSLGRPLYYFAKNEYHQSLSSDVHYLLKGFYRIRHGQGVAIRQLIECFSTQLGWDSSIKIDPVYLAAVEAIYGRAESFGYVAMLSEDEVYLHVDDIRKIEHALGVSFFAREDDSFFGEVDASGNESDVEIRQRLLLEFMIDNYDDVMNIPNKELGSTVWQWYRGKFCLGEDSFRKDLAKLRKAGSYSSEHKTRK